MLKFKSKVVRVQEMGGKFVVECKEKVFESGVEEPVVDTSDAAMYDTEDKAMKAVDSFFSG